MGTDGIVEGYLRRLGVEHPGQPTLEALHALQTAHVERVAYEVIDIHLGRFARLDARRSAEQICRHHRGGYCYQLNGAFSLLLSQLGYDVQWHRGGVQTRGELSAPGVAIANHLALTVHGLPTPQCPSGVWFVDAGLGDGIHEPLPLHEGTYEQGPMTFGLRRSEVEPGGWRFDHDPRGSFVGFDMRMAPATVADFQERHEYLSTSPKSSFVRTFCVQRRDAGGVDTLTGCVLRRVDAHPDEPRTLDQRTDWFGVLADVFRLPLLDLSPADRDALWRDVHTAHESWLATA
ncbi:arylamine N-acetyltransferase [Fodinicola feengrottensis]|uniref:Arylamine N-acetyltransferase n=1 Tax=Fodinicola feengrottensis TaxID=435914 RepID=A0ABP4SMP1_9ACTN